MQGQIALRVGCSSPARSQSMSCCSLRAMGCPVYMATMHSVTPVVAKAQQHPQADPFTCWFLTGPTMPFERQSTALGRGTFSYRKGSFLCLPTLATGRPCLSAQWQSPRAVRVTAAGVARPMMVLN